MRTKNRMRHLTIGAVLLTSGQVIGQASVPGNTGGPGDYLGWDINTNVTLDIGHENNLNINWFTDNIYRMRLNPTITNATINAYPTLDVSGNLGIGQFASNVYTPFTRLHLDNNGSSDAGFRPWMVTGTTTTRGSDLAYFGMKDEEDDQNHTVVTWSDNTPGVDGPDVLKFIFTRNNVGGATAATLDGLEAARFYPDASGNEVYFGVGDWFTASSNPTERVDLLDGNLRIRELPTLTSTLWDKVMVVDDDGVVHWRPASTLTGQTDCDWSIANPGTSGVGIAHHVTTATGSSPICPDNDDNVGIGNATPVAKLDVKRFATSGDERGIIAYVLADDVLGGFQDAVGIQGTVVATSTSRAPKHYGTRGFANNGSTWNVGILGTATNNSSNSTSIGNYGVKGEAGGPANCFGTE